MIFKSKYPNIKVPQVGIYQYVTSNPKKISDDKVIYVDGITGFKHGNVLAIVSPNQIDYPIVLLGTIAAGGKVIAANPKCTATELSYQLIDSGAPVLIVHPECLDVAIEASFDAKIPTSRILLFGDKEIKEYKPYCSILIGDHEIEPVSYTPEEAKSTTAYLLYSSRTTGKPKGIELTHTNIVANLAQLIIAECELGPHSTITGSSGATAIVHSSSSVETFCKLIQSYRINHIYASPPMIRKLVNDPLVQQFDLSSVDKIINATSPLSDKLERKFYEMFKIPIFQIYGLTETSLVLSHPDTMKNEVPGSSGILVPNMKAKILSEDGRELGYNEPGELWIQGPNIMKGYLNNKDATRADIDKDGFFRTGDIASVDEQDAAVIGYYSEKETTEIPTAYVTIKNGHKQSHALAKEIQSFVDEKVLPYKRLIGGILFIDKISKNVTGKIQRGLLREKLKNDIKE
ncbi:hypothetical protein C2G38_2238722 [Gigaspora rosea]|uniref:AMP-dependent synthetase/ligase domain-containing protein n=1 Tax=Gigaspora rosea TaxID=44941 RepID=A0A397W646_9GLOM|nr:hypothetical protein C2G38_2238722 [Gigaspora rosea]